MSDYVAPLALFFLAVVGIAFLYLILVDWQKSRKIKAMDRELRRQLEGMSSEELLVVFRDPSSYSAKYRALAEKILRARDIDPDEAFWNFGD